MTNLSPFRGDQFPERFRRWIEELRRIIQTQPDFMSGAGSPEGVVTAAQGSRYYNTTGGGGTYLYVKTTTTGNTGWVAYG